jgi:DNA-binding response OmpR family regulator
MNVLRATEPPRLLIIEDEPEFRAMLKRHFEAEGCGVAAAPDGPAGLQAHRDRSADLILLDLMLPGMDGFQVLRTLREAGDGVAVLMVTARAEQGLRERALAQGADGFLSKPFALADLTARVHRLLDRDGPAPGQPLVSGPFRLEGRTFLRDGCPLAIQDPGIRILGVLMANPGRILGRQEVLRQVWHPSELPGARVLDANVAMIWEALGEDRGWLRSVGGLGFCWSPPRAAGEEEGACRHDI